MLEALCDNDGRESGRRSEERSRDASGKLIHAVDKGNIVGRNVFSSSTSVAERASTLFLYIILETLIR